MDEYRNSLREEYQGKIPNPTMGVATQPSRSPAQDAALELDRALGQLSTITGAIEERMQPILKPDSPSPVEAGRPGDARRTMSPLVELLLQAAGQVNAINARLDRLVSRVEV